MILHESHVSAQLRALLQRSELLRHDGVEGGGCALGPFQGDFD